MKEIFSIRTPFDDLYTRTVAVIRDFHDAGTFQDSAIHTSLSGRLLSFGGLNTPSLFTIIAGDPNLRERIQLPDTAAALRPAPN